MTGPDHDPLTLSGPRPRRRRTLLAVGIVLLVAIGLAAWVGPRALSARRHLEAARASLSTAKTALFDRRLPDARAAIAAAGVETRQARRLTHDPAWWFLGHIPFAGRTFATVSGLAQAADDIARTVLPQAAAAVGDLDPHQLRLPGGGFNIALLRSAAPGLATASGSAQRADALAAGLPATLMPAQVVDARRQLVAQADELARALRAAVDAVDVAPALLGDDRLRRYFVLVQQTSETRGTGGLVGGYAVLVADKGHLSVTAQGNNSDLLAGEVPPPAGVPADFIDRYSVRGGFNDWRNINLSPDLPTVARMVQARWAAQHGAPVDGVISLDAIALADILRGSPPVDVGSGAPVAVDKLPQYLGAGQYQTFSVNQNQRKESLAVVARAATHSLTAGGGDTLTELRGLIDAVSSGHLRMASSDPALQPTLARTGLDGALPAGAAPVAYPVLFNTAGGKLDYYLTRSVDYRAGGCSGSYRNSTITTRITSTAPASGLPPYVTIRVVDGVPSQSYVDQVDLSVFTTRGARLASATLDGRPLSTVFGRSSPVLQTSSEDGLPIWEVIADVAPGQTRTLVLHLSEPTAHGAARVPEQPLGSPLASSVRVPRC